MLATVNFERGQELVVIRVYWHNTYSTGSRITSAFVIFQFDVIYFQITRAILVETLIRALQLSAHNIKDHER